jgi:hypothetical protein
MQKTFLNKLCTLIELIAHSAIDRSVYELLQWIRQCIPAGLNPQFLLLAHLPLWIE